MWLVGVVVRRYIDFLTLLISILLVYICSFWQQHSYFFVNLNKCFSLHFVIKMLCNFLHSRNTYDDYGHPTEAI